MLFASLGQPLMFYWLLLKESIKISIKRGKVYAVTLNTSKTFYGDSHAALIRMLNNVGITEKTFKLIQSVHQIGDSWATNLLEIFALMHVSQKFLFVVLCCSYFSSTSLFIEPIINSVSVLILSLFHPS